MCRMRLGFRSQRCFAVKILLKTADDVIFVSGEK
jgi:hypothetical protein